MLKKGQSMEYKNEINKSYDSKILKKNKKS